MRLKLALLALGASLLLPAQGTLTVEQLVSFIRSSIQLKQPDKQVADYLKKQKLSEKLSDRTIEDLQTLGVGQKTLQALRDLRDASANLPSPPPPAPAKPAPAPIPAPSVAEQQKIIDQVRDYALNYTKRLPDFICTQVTRRYVDPTGLEFWHQEDTITARLSYFEQKEDYKVILINNHYSNASYEQLGGATSTGEFGSLLREIFEPQTRAEFQWERWATLRGRRAYVFSYSIAQPNSRWRVSYQRREEVTPGYHGLIYIDRDLLCVLRVTLDANLPSSFPLQQATTVLDYDFADISGQEHLLPLRAEVRMREGKVLVKNDVEFRMYRKFSAEAQITFDTPTPDPLPEEKTKEQPAK